MEIYVNGDKRRIPDGATLHMLLREVRVNPQSVVVEHNETVVQKDAYESTSLIEGDKIEIVRFVGGGRF